MPRRISIDRSADRSGGRLALPRLVVLDPRQHAEGISDIVHERLGPMAERTVMAHPDSGPDSGFVMVDHVRLISPQDPWWPHWLREAGAAVPDGPIRPGVRMDSQANEGNAAMAGQGVAMLTPFFWRNDLAEGRLVMPFAQLSTRGKGYWLVVPAHRRGVPKIKRFREWLLAEIGRDREAGRQIERCERAAPLPAPRRRVQPPPRFPTARLPC